MTDRTRAVLAGAWGGRICLRQTQGEGTADNRGQRKL